MIDFASGLSQLTQAERRARLDPAGKGSRLRRQAAAMSSTMRPSTRPE